VNSGGVRDFRVKGRSDDVIGDVLDDVLSGGGDDDVIGDVLDDVLSGGGDDDVLDVVLGDDDVLSGGGEGFTYGVGAIDGMGGCGAGCVVIAGGGPTEG
jgi:hypothetical protein